MLHRKAARTIKKYSMLAPGDSVLVCVSGGKDSVCLLEVLSSLRSGLGIELSVCHLDHMLRKRESLEDARFAGDTARRLDLPFFSSRKNVRLHAARKKLSVEEAARRTRYRFFLQTARKHGQNKIALGHNLDDQAETVLLNLMRGGGPAGISGIPPARELGSTGIFIIRPLIDIPRDEIEYYLDSKKIPSREDSTNMQPVYMRNRVRLELIPLIEAHYAPGIRLKLAKTAEIMRSHMEHFLPDGEFLENLVRTGENSAVIAVKDLESLHPGAGRLLMQRAFNAAEKGETVLSYNQIELLTRMAFSSKPNARADLPSGITAVREYGAIFFSSDPPPVRDAEISQEMKVPGRNSIPALDLQIEFSVFRGAKLRPEGAAVDFDRAKLPLWIRGRKKGDRFSPLGMEGTKKIKDFLVDKKIPFRERRKTAVLTGADGAILALILPETRLIALEHKSRITPETKRVLQLRIV